MDIGAIELDTNTIPGGVIVKCLNEILFERRWSPRPMDTAFVVGFPEGFAGEKNTPIYKGATIASEPELGFDGSEVVLIDTVGNKGLSGAPVICLGNGIFNPNRKFDEETVLGSWKNFLGVYAGRLNEEGIGSQIGRVWKSSLIDEMLEATQLKNEA